MLSFAVHSWAVVCPKCKTLAGTFFPGEDLPRFMDSCPMCVDSKGHPFVYILIPAQRTIRGAADELGVSSPGFVDRA